MLRYPRAGELWSIRYGKRALCLLVTRVLPQSESDSEVGDWWFICHGYDDEFLICPTNAERFELISATTDRTDT